MRNELQIIQSAIGDPSPKEVTPVDEGYKYFKTYTVELPDRFKGLPPIWHFAIFPQSKRAAEELYQYNNAIASEARQIIRDAVSNGNLPLIAASDDLNFKINDHFQFEFEDDAVFFLDSVELPPVNFNPEDIQNKPFIRAVKSKFDVRDVPILLSPYSPNKPVTGWRFFGRKKELKDIVESDSNFFVIGSRKIGKTSLLKEVRRQMESRGQTVYWVKVQDATSIQMVMNEIARNLSYRDLYQLNQVGKEMDIHYLSSIIKRLKAETKKKIVLIFDELGNVLAKNKKDDWGFIGTLRELSHNNDIKVIISAFQEVFTKQKSDFNGPFVNFGTVLKINVFNNIELQDILINPLSIWTDIENKTRLIALIKNKFGTQPLILQFLGKYLFQKIFEIKNESIEEIINDLLVTDELLYFENAIEELFNINCSYLERYVFLQMCKSIESNTDDLMAGEITQKIIENYLEDLQVKTSLDERTFLLDRLTLKGLLLQETGNKTVYRIAAPIVYTFLRKYYPIDQLCLDYQTEIKKDEVLLSLLQQ